MSQQDIIDALVKFGATSKAKAVPSRKIVVYLGKANVSNSLRRMRNCKFREIAFDERDHGRFYYYLLKEKKSVRI